MDNCIIGSLKLLFIVWLKWKIGPIPCSRKNVTFLILLYLLCFSFLCLFVNNSVYLISLFYLFCKSENLLDLEVRLNGKDKILRM